MVVTKCISGAYLQGYIIYKIKFPSQKRGRQDTYNVRVWGVRVTIFSVKMQQCFPFVGVQVAVNNTKVFSIAMEME